MEVDISIMIPTCNGGRIFSDCMQMIGRQAYDGRLQLIVVDSGSTDGTVDVAKRAGALVKRIDKSAFHHARTRNMAVSLADFDRIIFMVQDAIPASDGWLSGMARGLDEDGVAAAFAAHIPHREATPYARFETESVAAARLASLDVKGFRSIESFKEMPYDQAYRSVGLDNVCAIYRKELLEKMPFPDVDFAEDMAWAVKVSFQGYRVLYLPHVQVRHSHNRSPDYAFRRQIVNSYWVARIMGRVREDFLFLGLSDLMSLTWAVRRFLLERIRESQHDVKHLQKGLFIDGLLRRFGFFNRLQTTTASFFLLRRIGRSSGNTERVGERVMEDIVYQLDLIEKGYAQRSGDEWLETTEQVAANILGRLYGEAYAARVMKGLVSQRMERFIRPYLSGV